MKIVSLIVHSSRDIGPSNVAYQSLFTNWIRIDRVKSGNETLNTPAKALE